MALTFKITVGCRSCTHPSIIVDKTCAHVLDSLVRTTKKSLGAVGTSTRADACAFTSEPQLSYRRRFQTGETPEGTCTHVPTPWVRVSSHSRETCTHVKLLGPCFKLGENLEKFAHMFRRHFPHDEMDSGPELAGVTTNSDGKRRTIGYRRRYV